ncbi:glycosyltransferase involved in cell wall biosynthesis [Wenyingzhuangia heitensis]|uniref:Glycosyltransferase involved in cell wall biosynthesis n=1 Tax=Wenyingzhuangia heitensis TaxID=1487859 RepID=A0ABX0UEG6_9FLAO|nr:glycosyltransferase family 4 protein [Wenyingzhuangia heitensis]NIJ45437.1 glycosyltransferase involved in cell wall biosynthesis [Wenyingzhuangia heitensis]
MKKVAIVCNYILKPDRIGGMDRFFKLFDEQLKKKGYIVDWFFTDYTAFDFYKELTIYSANNTSVEKKFIEVVSHHSYDVVITHFTELCTKFYKNIYLHNPDSYVISVDHNPRPLDGFSLKKRIKKRLEGVLYSKFIHQFIGVSQYTVNHILNDYGQFLKKKTKVVYNGIDTDVFVKRTQENKNKFIVASHLRPSKGIQDLLKALSYMNPELLEDVVVDIYGEGASKEELERLTKEYKLQKVITLKGSSSKLNELFCNYRYMIQPTYMECFSLSILESLSANIPVITTTVGGNLEVVENNKNGYIYNPGDCKALAAILENIITGENNITENTSDLIVQEFHLTKMVTNHINLLP